MYVLTEKRNDFCLSVSMVSTLVSGEKTDFFTFFSSFSTGLIIRSELLAVGTCFFLCKGIATEEHPSTAVTI